MTEESSAVPLTELEVITDCLEVYRRTARWKLEGLNREQATRSLVPSVSTLLGLLKRLAYVERWWFQGVIGGLDVEIPWSGGTRTRHSGWSQETPSTRSLRSMRRNVM